MISDERANELKCALLSGKLGTEGAEELLALFRQRPDLLVEVSSSLALDRLLGLASEPDAEAEAFSREVVERIGQRAGNRKDRFGKSVTRRLKPRASRWTRVALPVAAALVLFAGLGWLLRTDRALARVHSLADVAWTGDSTLVAGAALERDSRVEIGSGLLELALPGRGHVVLEGPASLSLHGKKDFSLTTGRAVFVVTPGGHGLTVRTPHGTAVDLGTCFALEVGEDSTELHVLEGRVTFEPPTGGITDMRAGQALRSEADEVVAIATDGGRFVRSVPTARRDTDGSWSWPCDEGFGMQTRTSDPAHAMRFKGADPGSAAPTWTTRSDSPAIEFDGAGAYAQSDFAGLAGSAPRTVALWVRVPEDWSPQDGGSLIAWGRPEWQQPGHFFELTLNRDPALGPIGAPQLDVSQHRVTAGIDLRDGEWHHLTVVTCQADESSSRTDVLIYLDGNLVSSYPRHVPRIDTQLGGNRHAVLLGRSLRSVNVTEPPSQDFFRGAVDDVFIGSGILSSSGIKGLMMGIRPAVR